MTLAAGDAAGRPTWAVEIDLGDPLTEGMAVVETGRAPAGPGEVAVCPDLAGRLDVGVGDTMRIGDESFRVTGVLTVPVALGDTRGLQVVGMPGDLPVTGPRSTAYLVERVPDAGDPSLDTPFYRASDWATYDDPLNPLRAQVAQLERDGVALTPRDLLAGGGGGLAGLAGVEGWRSAQSPWLLPVCVLVVLQLAVMTAPSLAVGVRQNRRMFALLQGAGADGRTLRRVVLGQAALMGLVGSVGAALLAVAVTAAVAAPACPGGGPDGEGPSSRGRCCCCGPSAATTPGRPSHRSPLWGWWSGCCCSSPSWSGRSARRRRDSRCRAGWRCGMRLAPPEGRWRRSPRSPSR